MADVADFREPTPIHPVGVGNHEAELAELLTLTGVRILGAAFELPKQGERDWKGDHARGSWSLAVEGPMHPTRDPRVMRRSVSCGSSATFRKPQLLNALFWRLGRDESLPPLTANDGRRVLVLLRSLAGVEES